VVDYQKGAKAKNAKDISHMGGLDRLEWGTIVPYVFWWLFPLTVAAIFTSFGYKEVKRRTKSGKIKKKVEMRSTRFLIGFSSYRNIKTTYVKKPPGWMFAIGWLIIYILIGVSTWMYGNWAADQRTVYDAQFGLLWVSFLGNVMWAPLFFTFRRLVLAWIAALIVCLTAWSVAALRYYDGSLKDVHQNYPMVWSSAGIITLYPLWATYTIILMSDVTLTMWNSDYFKKRSIFTGKRIKSAV